MARFLGNKMVDSIKLEHAASDQELYLAAKEAIRKYMLRIAVPSATVLNGAILDCGIVSKEATRNRVLTTKSPR
jgi:hypothetical protein